MEKKFILKLIHQCFQQYEDEAQSAVMNQEDMEELSKQVVLQKQMDPDTSFHFFGLF